jgi:hypothetical protein
MAETGKLGISDSLLANVQLAFAADEPTLPSITTQGGSLGGQLGDTILALAEVNGRLTFNLSAESVLVLAQTADPDPTIVAHPSPDLVLGGHDSQLGGLLPAFDGEPVARPMPTTQTGLLGTSLGNVIFGLDGVAGPRVFHLSAASALAIAQTADPAPTFVAHEAPHWVLGGQDSYLGGIELAYAGTPDPRPLTGDLTGKLGTVYSSLGSVRLALGLEEGESSGGISLVDAESALALSDEATVAVARSLAAESPISLVVDAGRNNLLAATGESAIDLDTAAEFVAVRTLAAESQISLTGAAGRNNLLSAVAESTISVSATAVEKVVRPLTAESVLALSDEATNTGRTIYEVAGESTLSLTVAVAFTVARAAVAESTVELTSEANGFNFPLLTAESAISLTSEAGRNSFPAVSAESAISLTSAAWHAQTVEVSAESAFSLTSEAGRNSFPAATAESAISLTSEAEGVNFPVVSAESPIILTDEAAATHVVGHRGDAWDWIPLWQWATVSVVRALSAENTIALAQTEHTARPWYVSAETEVQTVELVYDAEADDLVEEITGLDSTASVARPLTAAVQQSIPLHQTASAYVVKPTAIEVSAESVLDLLGEVHTNQSGGAGNWLVLHQTATVDKCKTVDSVLDLSQEAAVIVTVARGTASALNLKQAATFSIVSRGAIQQYTPFVGAGADGSPTPPSVTIGPPEHVALPFQLFYPAEGVVTDSVQLRAPNLGNKDRLSFNRILRETRGGTLIVFADPIWPKIQTLVLTFSGLRSVQTQQLLTFLEMHLGEEIGLLDWEGRAWKGIVTSPTDPVVQDGRDSFSASLEFEGELVPS